MIFGIIQSEDKVFTGDKIRFDASKTYLAPGLILAAVGLEISVDNITYYDITSEQKADWGFTTAGSKTIYLRVNTTTSGSQTFTKTITVIDLSTANLFSNDNDLYAYEPDIDRLLPSRWSSWNLISKEAQEKIVQWLDFKGIRKADNSQYVAADIVNKKEVREWSTLLTLALIYRGNSNQLDDVFKDKALKYEAMANEKSALAHIELAGNDSLNTTIHDTTDLRTITVLRR